MYSSDEIALALRSPGSTEHKNVRRWLMSLSEAEMFDLVFPLLASQSAGTLDILREKITKVDCLIQILKFGLRNSNPSEIREYIGCVLPGLGAEEAVDIVVSYKSGNRHAQRGGIYWLLPKVKDDVVLWNRLRKAARKFPELYSQIDPK